MPGVLLGSIQFVDREIPDTIKIGGQQKLAIHEQIGGTRVIDAMGPKPLPISWSGLFFGSSASRRARQVDALRQSGQQVPLSWGTFRYLVVVADFKADYKHEWEVRYSITCEVVTNLNSGSGAPISLTSIFAIDFANALSIINGFGSGSLSLSPSAIANINAAMNVIATAIIGNTSIPPGIVSPITNSLAAISGVMAENSTLNPDGLVTVNDSISTISGAVVGNPSITAAMQTEISDALDTIGSTVSTNTNIPVEVVSSFNDAQKIFNDAAKNARGSILNVSLAQLRPTVEATNSALEKLDNAIGIPNDGIDLRANPKEASVLDGINNFANEVTSRSMESDRRTLHSYLGRIDSNLNMLAG